MAVQQGFKTCRDRAILLITLIGELSRSINHGEAGTSRTAINDLIDRLEYIEQTGDGELDIF